MMTEPWEGALTWKGIHKRIKIKINVTSNVFLWMGQLLSAMFMAGTRRARVWELRYDIALIKRPALSLRDATAPHGCITCTELGENIPTKF